MTQIRLSREELYEKVWSKALIRLAPEFGISDRGLAKLCKRMEIPVPGLGYWRKVELGHKVYKEPLPKPSDKCERFASFWVEGIVLREAAKKSDEDPLVARVKDFESKPENKILVPETIRKFHPLVKNTLDALRKGSVDDYGRSHSYGEDHITLTCSKKAAPRAGQLLHTLIKELEKRGNRLIVKRCFYKYSPGWSEVRTFIVYAEEEIQISVMEKARRFERPVDKNKYSWGPKYDSIPTGELVIKASVRGWYAGKQSWSDTPKKKLEEQLNSMMIDLAKIAVHLKQEREKEEQQEREAELRRQEEERLRLKELEEQKRIDYLEGLLSQWVKAERIREFLTIAEKLPINPKAVDMEKQEWLEWARDYADRLDPLFFPVNEAGSARIH
jgi:hypothetical protein